jgi:hypothetical protein
MDQNEDPQELERKIERGTRLASGVTDQTTYERLHAFIEELRRMLQQRLAARRLKEQVRLRAHELWEQHKRPPGRDVEFWLQAESELKESSKQNPGGDAMSTSKKPLKPDDFPVSSAGTKIKKQDGTTIANTDDPAVADDVADRLNEDEAQREEDKWSA